MALSCWGPGLFDSDMALDMYGVFRDLMGDGLTPAIVVAMVAEGSRDPNHVSVPVLTAAQALQALPADVLAVEADVVFGQATARVEDYPAGLVLPRMVVLSDWYERLTGAAEPFTPADLPDVVMLFGSVPDFGPMERVPC